METCRRITRKSASNLALAFVLLPRAKREGMSALYAFCREVDDVADEDALPLETRRTSLAAWREDIRVACEGGVPLYAVNRELQPILQRHGLPFALFDELLRGVETDLDTLRYDTYDQLELYCYRVASVVGLLSIEIFGYQNPRCRDYAVLLGKALQFTNILRDVRNDAQRGRVYFPRDELQRHGLTPEDVLAQRYTPQFRTVAHAVAERARRFYREARQTLPAEDRRSMIAAELMGAVYWRLLQKLEEREFNVFAPDLARIGKLQKLFLTARTYYRVSSGAATPNYGVP
jgi:phytoene synthase